MLVIIKYYNTQYNTNHTLFVLIFPNYFLMLVVYTDKLNGSVFQSISPSVLPPKKSALEIQMDP